MKRYCLLIVSLLVSQAVSASHLLGGYISAKSQAGQPLVQQITVYLYLDEAKGSLASADLNAVTVCFGDGSQKSATRIRRTVLSSEAGVSLNLYQTDYTYAGPGTYTVSIALANRSELVNLTGGTVMALQTNLNVRLANSTPIIPVLPTSFQPSVYQVFNYPMAAIDADGDSLAYRLALPLTTPAANGVCGTTFVPAPNFLFPNAVQQKGTFKLNAKTGQLTWNAPTAVGQHVFAIVVEEWRGGQLIGQTQVEQVLTVRDAGGTPVVVPPYEQANTAPNGLVTGLSDSRTYFQLVTSPNPVTDYLTVQWQNSESQATTLRLFGVDGRLVQGKTTPASTAILDLRALPDGVYWLVIDSNDRRIARKIVRD